MLGPSTIDFQLTVLQHLANNQDVSGRDLREHVEATLNCRLRWEKFYAKMVDMENEKYVRSEVRPKIVEGVALKETIFNIEQEIGASRRAELLSMKARLGPDGALGGLAPA